MEINTKKIFERMNLQHIRAFMLEGLDPMEVYGCTYDERLKKGNMSMIKRLKTIYKDEQEFSDAVDDFYNAQIINGEVYTEIGMKAGARLLMQLLLHDDNL